MGHLASGVRFGGGPPAPAGSVVDDFEYADSIANHGWTFGAGTSDAQVFTSTEQFFNGARSMKSVRGAGAGAHELRFFNPPRTGDYDYEVAIYDTGFTTGQAATYFAVRDDAGLANIGSGGINTYSSTTHYWVSDGVSTNTSHPRTNGWHVFRFQRTGTLQNIYIDGTLRLSTTVSSVAIDSLFHASFNDAGGAFHSFLDFVRSLT